MTLASPRTEELLTRVKKLFLLRFTEAEMIEPVSHHLGVPVSLADIAWAMSELRRRWGTAPGQEESARAQGELWALSEMFRVDLMGLYQDALSNARATMEGLHAHPDNRPVIPTKPSEVLALAKDIRKMAADSVSEQREALRHSGISAPAAPTAPKRFEVSDEDEEIALPERTEL